MIRHCSITIVFENKIEFNIMLINLVQYIQIKIYMNLINTDDNIKDDPTLHFVPDLDLIAIEDKE